MPMMMPFFAPSVMPVGFGAYQQPRRVGESGSANSCCAGVQSQLREIADELKQMNADLDVLSNQVNGHGKAIEQIIKIFNLQKSGDDQWKQLLK